MSHGRLCRATGCQRVFVRCFSRENETKTQAFHAFRAMLATVCLCCLSMCPRSFSKSRNDREPKPSRWGAKGRRQNTKGTATDLRTPNSSLASGPHLAALHGDFRFTRARRGFWGRNSPNCFRTAAKSASQPLYCADLCLFFFGRMMYYLGIQWTPKLLRDLHSDGPGMIVGNRASPRTGPSDLWHR